jgi:tetraacyldisaccharide 4'-kinase
MLAIRQKYFQVINNEMHGILATLLRLVLIVLSWIYSSGIAATRFLYLIGLLRRQRLGRPVISVGNITWGGVGKTPLVIWLAQYLNTQGFKPAILTRGYRKRGLDNDEILLLRQTLPDVPILVGRNRALQAREFLNEHNADLFLLDDGFQHWPLQRDLDIVAIDAGNPWGNGRLLPAGILREPVGSLARADLLIITKMDFAKRPIAELKNSLAKISVAPVILSQHCPTSLVKLPGGQQRDLALLRNQEVVALCSIGDPQSFTDSLAALGARVRRHFVFPDHHWYAATDIRKIVNFARDSQVKVLVTTEKDAVKIIEFKSLFVGCECLVLKIAIQFTEGKDELLNRVNRLLQR